METRDAQHGEAVLVCLDGLVGSPARGFESSVRRGTYQGEWEGED